MRGRRTGADDDEAAISGHPTPPREGDVAMPVREEELTVNKERREAGRSVCAKMSSRSGSR